MGNVIDSFAQGIGTSVGKLFSSPVEFLSGKSCSSVCGPTWDLVCYIENFCIANLFRLSMVFVLLYAVLLFFYLLHKLGIFGCIGRSICKIVWACCSSCCCIWEYACTFLCVKLRKIRRRRRRCRREMMNNRFYSITREGLDSSDESLSYHSPSPEEMSRSFSRRRRDYKESHLRKSLRPRSDHARVEINSRNLGYRNKRHHSSDPGYSNNAIIKHGEYNGTVHDIKITRASKFARKGVSNRKRIVRR